MLLAGCGLLPLFLRLRGVHPPVLETPDVMQGDRKDREEVSSIARPERAFEPWLTQTILLYWGLMGCLPMLITPKVRNGSSIIGTRPSARRNARGLQQPARPAAPPPLAVAKVEHSCCRRAAGIPVQVPPTVYRLIAATSFRGATGFVYTRYLSARQFRQRNSRIIPVPHASSLGFFPYCGVSQTGEFGGNPVFRPVSGP